MNNLSQQVALKGQESDTSLIVENQRCPKCFQIAHFLLGQLQRYEECNQNMDMYVQQSILSAFTLTILINDLLDLAKMETATFKLATVQFNLIEVISEAYQILSFQAEHKGIKLLIEFLNNKPFILRKVSGDRRRFLQILINFISNSLKFTPKGGFIRTSIAILDESILEEKDPVFGEQIYLVYDLQKSIKLRLTIEDSGVGIKKENLDKIFKDYSMLEEHQEMN